MKTARKVAETPQEKRDRELHELGADSMASIREMVAAMDAKDADGNDDDDARETAIEVIREDALSVEIRADWREPGAENEDSEFRILLCTGGPAVRIVGELRDGQPHRAWLECQDWGTPWTEYIERTPDKHNYDHPTPHSLNCQFLLAYASCFYFGEG